MLFDRSLRKDLGRSFGATLVVILIIVITSFLVRALNQAAGGDIAPQDVALLLGYAGLQHLPTLLTLSLFIAVVSTLTRLYRDSEMVVWLSSGLGLSAFVGPVLRSALPVLAVVALLAFFVWPWSNQQVVELRERYQRRSDLARIAPGQFISSSDGRRVFFVDRDPSLPEAGLAEDAARGGARNIFLLEQQPDSESLTAARGGRIEWQGGDRYVVLEQGQRNDLDLRNGERRQARFDSYRVLAGEQAASPSETLPPKARSSWALLQEPTPRHQGELVWRAGLALGGVPLVLFGIGLAGGNPRRPGSWNLLTALLGFFAYYNLLVLSQSWVASGKAAALPTLLLLHGGGLLAALGLLLWRERGIGLGLRRRGRAAIVAGA